MPILQCSGQENAKWRRRDYSSLRDLLTSRRPVKDNAGHKSRYPAWPWGTGRPTVDRFAAEAGFE
jgi:hypothetical protein